MITPATCPNCGKRELAEIDLIVGYARVSGICDDGSVEWTGDTDVDWNSQLPMHDPPRFTCISCGCTCELKDGEFVVRVAASHGGVVE